MPPINETTDGWYHNDHAHLSPTVDRLASWDYRQSIRKWFNHLDPPPTTLVELKQRWLLNWPHARGQCGLSAQDSTPMDSLIEPPTLAAQQSRTPKPQDLHPAYTITHPHFQERSTQTPHARVVDKGTQVRQPTGKPKWTQYYADHRQSTSLTPRQASPVDDKSTCTCHTGSTHCKCQRS